MAILYGLVGSMLAFVFPLDVAQHAQHGRTICNVEHKHYTDNKTVKPSDLPKRLSA